MDTLYYHHDMKTFTITIIMTLMTAADTHLLGCNDNVMTGMFSLFSNWLVMNIDNMKGLTVTSGLSVNFVHIG